LKQAGLNVIWQTGNNFTSNKSAEMQDDFCLKVFPFIYQMDLAYAAADLVVSRAGALSIAELAIVGKPTILVPSPNVSEDHQTKNAQALVDKNAAIMVANGETVSQLLPQALELLQNETKRNTLAQNILALAKPNAAEEIAEQVLSLVKF
jgi:UDP-N-acetylglucosamine--N-acetylmuramyl-(pentapeptide) pyrophosphoryl-undecaprenol N-acetylglucosamine transferase